MVTRIKITQEIVEVGVTQEVSRIIVVSPFSVQQGILPSEFNGKGVILIGTGVGTFIAFTPGANGTYLKYDSTQPAGVVADTPVLTIEDTVNYLMNGGFNFARRQVPGTLTTIASGSYGPDRWKVYAENASVQYRRVDASSESGLTSPYMGEFSKITNAGKFLVAQPLENLDTLKFRGKTVSFQLKMKANTTKRVKIAIAELQAAGVADTIPAIVSAWGADTVDPTFGANLAVITTSVACDLTTSMQTFSFSGTFPATSKNLLVMVWSDSDMAVSDTVTIAEASLYIGSSVRSWNSRLMSIERPMLDRYYWKTFPEDIAPATNAGLASGFMFPTQVAGATTQVMSQRFPVGMRTTPTVVTFNPSAANAQVRNDTAGADCTTTTVAASTSKDQFSITAVGPAGGAIGQRLWVHITADAEL